MTRLPLREGQPLTFPACRCGTLMERHVLPANQDNPRVSFHRCRACAVEQDHLVAAPPEPKAAPAGLVIA